MYTIEVEEPGSFAACVGKNKRDFLIDFFIDSTTNTKKPSRMKMRYIKE